MWWHMCLLSTVLPKGSISIPNKLTHVSMISIIMVRTQVHEEDIIEHYELLKEYLLTFASGLDGLPDLEHHKARIMLITNFDTMFFLYILKFSMSMSI